MPWVVRRLEDEDGGDEVPEVLCNGTFHWYTEIPSRDSRAVRQQKNAGQVAYRVQITSPLEVKDKDVEIFVHSAPALDVSVNSMLYATVPSPLSHILIDYKNLRQAQIRRSHADAWNTTAKLICSFKPTIRVQVRIDLVRAYYYFFFVLTCIFCFRRKSPAPPSWTSRTTPTTSQGCTWASQPSPR